MKNKKILQNSKYVQVLGKTQGAINNGQPRGTVHIRQVKPKGQSRIDNPEISQGNF
jgi:hypothetical protein